MTLNDDFDVKNLLEAHHETQRLEAVAIDRARLYLEAQRKPSKNFRNENGFVVTVNRDSLLDSNYVDVMFYHTDAQGRGATQTVMVPRSVLFGAPTQDELDFLEYKRLQAMFEK
jgi:hypothetical protein